MSVAKAVDTPPGSVYRVDMTTQTATKPRIRWYVYTGGTDDTGRRERIPRASTMRGWWPGYDAECSCGWATNTGGAIHAYIEREVWFHKGFECPLRQGAEA